MTSNGKVLAIGHRGAAGVAPENTKMSFVKALDLGADAIELDVTLTEDEVVIVFHDDTLERTTNGRGRVSETEFRKIAELDAGGWFGASFTGIEVPTLEEVLQVFGGRTTINVELKPDLRMEQLVKRVVESVARFQLFDSILFSSFHHDAMTLLRDLVPEARIGILCQIGGFPFAVSHAERLGAETIHPQAKMVDHELVHVAHEKGFGVWTWTANEPGEITLLKAMGVDGIFSDYPDRIARPRGVRTG